MMQQNDHANADNYKDGDEEEEGTTEWQSPYEQQ